MVFLGMDLLEQIIIKILQISPSECSKSMRVQFFYSMYMKLRLYVLEIVTVLKEQMVQSFLWLLKEHPYFVQCILFAVDSDYYRLSGQICNLVSTYWLLDL